MRQSSTTVTRSGITLRLSGRASTLVGVTVAASASTGSQGWSPRSSQHPSSTAGSSASAFSARDGALACPARPWITTSSSAHPRWPMEMSPWVASPMITASGTTARESSRCCMPSPPRSSSTVCATITSPRARPLSAAAAWVWIASGPLMSIAPRPWRKPSATAPAKGGCSQVSASPAATTSRWEESITRGPPAVPRTTPITLPTSSTTMSSKPRRVSSSRTRAATSSSWPGSEGIRIRSWANARVPSKSGPER